mgnify:FL=1
MNTNERTEGVRIELYERRELPPPARDQVDDVYAELVALVERGEIETVNRQQWAKRMPIADCDATLRDTYLAFSDWATEHGVRLTPFFQTRECFSPAEQAYTDWLVLPAFCLAVYENQTLSAVYPHGDDTDTKTVRDGVRSLAADGGDETEPELAAAD